MILSVQEIKKYYYNGSLDDTCVRLNVTPSELVGTLLERIDDLIEELDDEYIDDIYIEDDLEDYE